MTNKTGLVYFNPLAGIRYMAAGRWHLFKINQFFCFQHLANPNSKWNIIVAVFKVKCRNTLKN